MEESKQIAAHALARLGNISAAARLAGVDRSTVHRWLRKDADFAELVERLVQDIGAILHARTLEHLGHAIDRAAQLVDSPNERVALAAVRIFIDLASRSAGDWATRTTPDLALHRVHSIIALQAVEGDAIDD